MNNNTKNETVKKEVYLVEGMSCSGCDRTIQKVVTNPEGPHSLKLKMS